MVCVIYAADRMVERRASAEFQTPSPLPPKPDIYLEALKPQSFKTGWQAEGVRTWCNVNCHGQPLKVLGETFTHGVGMHANGEVVFLMKPHTSRLFAAWASTMRQKAAALPV